ncbi:MAG TPA: exodeoxyribonuclease VII small subunit [Phycisphaerae bacterium]|nr:exodeoxyribonuclease VII small subunit [Phycisphaerae bacterium]
MADAELSFEAALARAEEIATAIEQGKVGLEESIQQFEEGMRLIKHCREVLCAAELCIEKLEAAGMDGAAPAGEMRDVDVS